MDTISSTTVPTTSPVLTVATFGAEYLGEALAKVAKFNARAARHGITARFETAHSTTEVETPARVLGLPSTVHEITTFAVLGQPLVVEGWEFIATLSFDSEAGVITRPVPGTTELDLTAYRSLEIPVCDECNTRRYRKDIYVLLNAATGETKVVGKNCLAGFLGLDVSGAIAYVGAILEGHDTGDYGFGLGERRVPAATLIALASAATAEYGWVSKAAYEGVATARRVEQVLFPAVSGKQATEDAEVARRLNARLVADGGVNAAQKRADSILEWVRTTGDLKGEYGTNLKAILSADTVSTRNLGLAVSAVVTWSKAVEREIERAARATQQANSEYVGTVGVRIKNLALTVSAPPRFFDGDYGTTTLIVFTDEAGNTYKWFASGSRDASVGDKATGAGTVKKHEEYNGLKSTVLTRCKFDEL